MRILSTLVIVVCPLSVAAGDFKRMEQFTVTEIGCDPEMSQNPNAMREAEAWLAEYFGPVVVQCDGGDGASCAVLGSMVRCASQDLHQNYIKRAGELGFE